MAMEKTVIVLSVVGGLLSGCAGEVGDGEALGTEQDPIYASTSALWLSPPGSSETPISICFEGNIASTRAADAGWVRDALETSWDAASGVDFTGYGACGSAQVHIVVDDGTPHVEALGARTVYLNFDFRTWSTSCQANREFCIR